MLENIRGHSRGSIPPLRMPSPLPHDLCHEWNVSRRLPGLPNTYTKIISKLNGNSLDSSGSSLIGQKVKNLPARQGTLVPTLGQEAPWEEGIAIHPSILAWQMPWTEEPGRLQSMGSQRVGHK